MAFYYCLTAMAVAILADARRDFPLVAGLRAGPVVLVVMGLLYPWAAEAPASATLVFFLNAAAVWWRGFLSRPEPSA